MKLDDKIRLYDIDLSDRLLMIDITIKIMGAFNISKDKAIKILERDFVSKNYIEC